MEKEHNFDFMSVVLKSKYLTISFAYKTNLAFVS